MLAFAAVFSLTVERSVAGAFAAASLIWLCASVAAWFARRNLHAAHGPRATTTPRCRGTAE